MIPLGDALSSRLQGHYEIESLDGLKFVRVDSLTLSAIREGRWELDFDRGKHLVHRIAADQPGGSRPTIHFTKLNLWLPVTTSRGFSHDNYRW